MVKFGEVQCPGDKSISQRVLIIGAFMNQDMVIDGFLHGKDPLNHACTQSNWRRYFS